MGNRGSSQDLDCEAETLGYSTGVIAFASIISHSVRVSCLSFARLLRGTCSAGSRSNALVSVINAARDNSRSTLLDALNQLALRPQSLLNSCWVFTRPSALVLSKMVWKRSLFFTSYLCSARLVSDVSDDGFSVRAA